MRTYKIYKLIKRISKKKAVTDTSPVVLALVRESLTEESVNSIASRSNTTRKGTKKGKVNKLIAISTVIQC